jgi:hypothetical protein
LESCRKFSATLQEDPEQATVGTAAKLEENILSKDREHASWPAGPLDKTQN